MTTPEAAYVAGGDACIEDERLERPTSEGPEDPELRVWWCRGYSTQHVTEATMRLAMERAAAEERLRVEQIVARVAYAERDAAHAALTTAGVEDGRDEGDPPTGHNLTTRIRLLIEQRSDARNEALTMRYHVERLVGLDVPADQALAGARLALRDYGNTLDLFRVGVVRETMSACPTCKGRGVVMRLNDDRVTRDEHVCPSCGWLREHTKSMARRD